MKVVTHCVAEGTYVLIDTPRHSISIRVTEGTTPAQSLQADAVALNLRASALLERAALLNEAAKQLEAV